MRSRRAPLALALLAAFLVACGEDETQTADAASSAPPAPAAPPAPTAPTAPTASEVLPPIRVVRAGFGNLEGLKNNIMVSVAACLSVRYPGSVAPDLESLLPPDEVLAKLRIIEIEELFDGQMWAEYKTFRTIAADKTQGCGLALFSQRSVDVERTCELTMSGLTDLRRRMDAAVPDEETSDQAEIMEDRFEYQSCAAKLHLIDFESTPSEDAGAARCKWTMSAIAASSLLGGEAPQQGGDPVFDLCAYEKLPQYHYRGKVRTVALKSQSNNLTLGGNDLGKLIGATTAFGNQRLIEFSDGTPISASRFTKAAMSEFLRLPSVTPVGSP